MPVTFTQTTTKPEASQWYAQASEANRLKTVDINAWTASCPGFISQNLDKTNPHVRVYTVVFDTVENYASWNTARLAHPDAAERAAHNTANGITFTNEETIS